MLGSSASSVVGLTTTYAAIVLDAPRDFRGGSVSLKLTDIVTGTAITWYLAADATGDQPITPVRTLDPIVGITAATGGVASSLEQVPFHLWATAAQIWVIAKINAGTANATARLAWSDV